MSTYFVVERGYQPRVVSWTAYEGDASEHQNLSLKGRFLTLRTFQAPSGETETLYVVDRSVTSLTVRFTGADQSLDNLTLTTPPENPRTGIIEIFPYNFPGLNQIVAGFPDPDFQRRCRENRNCCDLWINGDQYFGQINLEFLNADFFGHAEGIANPLRRAWTEGEVEQSQFGGEGWYLNIRSYRQGRFEKRLQRR